MKYKCKMCNYITDRKSNIDFHFSTNRHKKNINPDPDSSKITDALISEKDKRIKDLENFIKILQEDKEKTIQLLKEETDKSIQLLQNEVKSYTTIINGANGVVNKQLSVIQYLTKNHNDAPALITYDDFSNIKYVNTDRFTREIIYHYKNNSLVKFLSDCIINEYKKEDPKEQSIWTSDTSRLTYIIKELLKDNTTIWSMDKKGIKVKKYIIQPLLKFIKDELKLHSTNFEYNEDTDILEQSYEILNALDIVKLIDNGTLENNILRVIAPYFTVDNKVHLLQ